MSFEDKDTLEDLVLMTELVHTGVNSVYHTLEVVYLLVIFSIDFLLGTCLCFFEFSYPFNQGFFSDNGSEYLFHI